MASSGKGECPRTPQSGPGVTPGAGSSAPRNDRAPSFGTSTTKTSPNSDKRGAQG